MASGINTTFRQVGIATGIAVFGTLFATRLTDSIVSGLRGSPAAGHGQAIATAFSQGQGQRAIAALPPAVRPVVAQAARAAFVSGLNEILVVAGVGALVAAAVATLLIRRRDFVASHAGPPAQGQQAGEGAGERAAAGAPREAAADGAPEPEPGVPSRQA
jgi:hypothetical protein